MRISKRTAAELPKPSHCISWSPSLYRLRRLVHTTSVIPPWRARNATSLLCRKHVRSKVVSSADNESPLRRFVRHRRSPAHALFPEKLNDDCHPNGRECLVSPGKRICQLVRFSCRRFSPNDPSAKPLRRRSGAEGHDDSLAATSAPRSRRHSPASWYSISSRIAGGAPTNSIATLPRVATA